MAAAVFAALSFTRVLDGAGVERVLGAAGAVVGVLLQAVAIRLLMRRGGRGEPR